MPGQEARASKAIRNRKESVRRHDSRRTTGILRCSLVCDLRAAEIRLAKTELESPSTSLLTITPEEWQEQIDSHLTAT